MIIRKATKILSSFLSSRKLFRSTSKLRLSSTFDEKKSLVVMSDDGNTIVCWHPESAPPYESTKPIPHLQPEFNEGDSAIKLQYRKDEAYAFKPDGPTIKELSKMTYTSKHRWYPNNKDRYLDPNPPIDREGL